MTPGTYKGDNVKNEHVRQIEAFDVRYGVACGLAVVMGASSRSADRFGYAPKPSHQAPTKGTTPKPSKSDRLTLLVSCRDRRRKVGQS